MAGAARDIAVKSSLATQLLLDDPAACVQVVKKGVHEKLGIPAEQQRLIFASAALGSGVTVPDLPCGDLLTEAHKWQAIVFSNDKSVGRLVEPRVDLVELPCDSFQLRRRQYPLYQICLTYDHWQPIEPATKKPQQTTPISIPVDAWFKSALWRLKLIGEHRGTVFVVPFACTVSGSETVASLSLHLQNLEYRRAQHLRFAASTSSVSGSQVSPAISYEYTVGGGSPLQQCSLTFCLESEPATLNKFELRLAVLQQGVVNDTPNSLTAYSSSTTPFACHPESSEVSGMATLMDDIVQTEKGTCIHSKTKKKKQPQKKKPAYDEQSSGDTKESCSFLAAPNKLAGSSLASQTTLPLLEDMLKEALAEELGCLSNTAPQAFYPGDTLGSTGSVYQNSGNQTSSHTQQGSGCSGGSGDPEGGDSGEEGQSDNESFGGRRNNSGGGSGGDKDGSGNRQPRDHHHYDDETKKHKEKRASDNDDNDDTDPETVAENEHSSQSNTQPALAALENPKPCPPPDEPSQEMIDATVELSSSEQSDRGAENRSELLKLDDSFVGESPSELAAGAALGWREGHSHAVEPPLPANPVSVARVAVHHRQNGKYVHENGKLKNGIVTLPNGLNFSYLAEDIGAVMESEVNGTQDTSADMLSAGPAVDLSSGAEESDVLPSNRTSSIDSSGAPSTSSCENFEPDPATSASRGYGPRSHQVVSLTNDSFKRGHQRPPAQPYPPQYGGKNVQRSTNPRMQRGEGESKPQGRSYREEGQGVMRPPPSESPPPQQQQSPAPTTDLERFLVQVTPMLHLDQTKSLDQSLQELCLEDVWRFYLEPSLYGREVYTLGGSRGPSWCYFVPYLSAIQLFTPTSPKDPGTNKLYLSDVDGWPKHMHLVFEFFERELPFNRLPMYEHIEQFSSVDSKIGPGRILQEAKISQLHPASWFAVAWYPVYRIPDAPLCSRFLTFHSFAPLVMSINNAHAAQEACGVLKPIPTSMLPLQVIGLKWYNFQGERWLENLPESASTGSTDETSRGVKKQQPQASQQVDIAWHAHLSELQTTAERLARGIGLRVLGQMGAEEAKLRHPDFEFFHTKNY